MTGPPLLIRLNRSPVTRRAADLNNFFPLLLLIDLIIIGAARKVDGRVFSAAPPESSACHRPSDTIRLDNVSDGQRESTADSIVHVVRSSESFRFRLSALESIWPRLPSSSGGLHCRS